jgi:hypothetical protein
MATPIFKFLILRVKHTAKIKKCNPDMDVSLTISAGYLEHIGLTAD